MLSEKNERITLPGLEERRKIIQRAGLVLAEAQALSEFLDWAERSPVHAAISEPLQGWFGGRGGQEFAALSAA
jgi:hypothetical protein